MKRFYFILLISIFSCSGKSTVEHEINEENNQKTVACFIYHRFGDSRFPSTNIATKDFEAHLRYLMENDYQVLTLSGALDYLSSDQPLKKTVVITIDDGYKSFYANGLPLLKKYNFPATLFINTSTVGGGDYMSWQQLEESLRSNIEIGNHTHTHAYFLNEPEAIRYKSFENELIESQNIINEKLGIKPSVFAYPYGEYDQGMKDVVEKSEFRCGMAQNSGVLYNGTDLYQIPRFPMAETFASLHHFAEKASMKPLRIVNQTPIENVLKQNNLRPALQITFRTEELLIENLQCFVQGSTFEKQITENDSLITVTLKASDDLSARRRTLYTVTIPDKTGTWHWFSHLWINNRVK